MNAAIIVLLIGILLITGCVQAYGNETESGTIEPQIQNVTTPGSNATVITSLNETNTYP